MEKLKLSIDEVIEVTGEAKNAVYKAIDHGHLETFLVGRRRFARPASVRNWVDFLESESKAGRPVFYQKREEGRLAA